MEARTKEEGPGEYESPGPSLGASAVTDTDQKLPANPPRTTAAVTSKKPNETDFLLPIPEPPKRSGS